MRTRPASVLNGLLVAFLLPLLTALSGVLSTPGNALADSRVATPAAVSTTVVERAVAAPCTSGDAAVCLIREMTPEEREQARQTRIRYHLLLETMERTADEMRALCATDEEIARVLVEMRNQAKDLTRTGMTVEQVAALEQRNMEKYGNPLGPTADQQYARYGSWAKVIEAATRSNAAVDQKLGLEPRG